MRNTLVFLILLFPTTLLANTQQYGDISKPKLLAAGLNIYLITPDGGDTRPWESVYVVKNGKPVRSFPFKDPRHWFNGRVLTLDDGTLMTVKEVHLIEVKGDLFGIMRSGPWMYLWSRGEDGTTVRRSKF